MRVQLPCSPVANVHHSFAVAPMLIKGAISRTIYLVSLFVLGAFMGTLMGWCLFGSVQAVLSCMVLMSKVLLTVLSKIIFYIPIIYIADIASDLLIKTCKTTISLINATMLPAPQAAHGVGDLEAGLLESPAS